MSENLSSLIQAGHPLISIQTVDEPRAEFIARDAAFALDRNVFIWSLTTGLQPVTRIQAGAPVVTAGNSLPALEYLKSSHPLNTVVIFKDFAPHCKDARIHRHLRDLIIASETNGNCFVLIDTQSLPEELRLFSHHYEIGWPSTAELDDAVKQTFRRVKRQSQGEITLRLTKRDHEQLLQTLRGLTISQAEKVVAAAINDDNALTAADLPRIIDSKRAVLNSTGALESIAADFNAADIGGLKRLKVWLKQRRGGFTQKARNFGIEFPRGVLMLGVPGCGKSLCAKVVAADWKMPLLRLDPGVLYQKFVGETENQLRQAISQAESMAPVILWIDEIEKAFASASAQSADGGLSKRMFGTLLSWMQDHRHPIFIIATANDISALPPELMRKGRFDEVFFVDLPTHASRRSILEIHLKRRKRDPEQFDLETVADHSDGFSGSELEQLIVGALFSAFSNQEELATCHLLNELKNTQPLSVLNGERITELRNWARNRCVPAD